MKWDLFTQLVFTLRWILVMLVVQSSPITWRLFSVQLLWSNQTCSSFARTCLCLKVSLKQKFSPRRWLYCTNFPKNSFQNNTIMTSSFVRWSLCWSWLVNLNVHMLKCLRILCWWELFVIWTCPNLFSMMSLYSMVWFRTCSRVFVLRELVMKIWRKSLLRIWKRKVLNIKKSLNLRTKSTRWFNFSRPCKLVTQLWSSVPQVPVSLLS